MKMQLPSLDHTGWDFDERSLGQLAVLERSGVERKGSVPVQRLDLGADQIPFLQVLSHGELVLGGTPAKFAAGQIHRRELKRCGKN